MLSKDSRILNKSMFYQPLQTGIENTECVDLEKNCLCDCLKYFTYPKIEIPLVNILWALKTACITIQNLTLICIVLKLVFSRVPC